ncbi:MAG: insulinase family protein [Bacteroidaceae bacterium]|nr:insulinase family protein [Bacteroidaceae bacterium]
MKITTFEVGGLRVVFAPGTTNVVYAGISVDAGTRDEKESESGMAHFIEHMSFKGTSRRSSMQILNRMENVGADLNAFTTKEDTTYYSVFLREHLSRAIDLLLDITFHSTFPQVEMDKEVEVVCDEIESYNDSPSELIYDDFEALLFPGHPLGRNILGSAERLHEYHTADLQAFARRLYHPRNAVMFVMGNVRPEEVRRLVERGCMSYPCAIADDMRKSRVPPEWTVRAAAGKSEPVVMNKGVHQAHVVLGSRAYPVTHPRYMAAALLNNILGGPGLNSRLSISLRERRGLVYTVESTLTAYTDAGFWTTYFGCDPEDVRRCLRLVATELRHLVEKPLTPHQLIAAKRQMKGQLGVSYDNFENVAISMGKRYLHHGLTTTPEELLAKIDAVTAEDLQRAAADLLMPEAISTLIYMP